MPELPHEMAARFVADYGVSDYDARLLTASRAQAAYFEEAAKACGQGKLTANWMNGELAATLNKEGLNWLKARLQLHALPSWFAKVADGTLSSKLAKKALKRCGLSLKQVLPKSSKNMVCNRLLDTGAIEAMVDEVLANNAKAIEQFRSGNEKSLKCDCRPSDESK